MPYPPDCVYNVHILGEGGRPGSSVNIMTQAGADAFIGSGNPYIATNLEEIDKLRIKLDGQQQRQRNRQQRQQQQQQLSRQELGGRLEAMYVMLDCIAECSTPSVFAQRVPAATELQALLDHAVSVFSGLSTSQKWTKTGVLTNYDQQLLDCLISHCKHWNFVQLLVVKDKKQKNKSDESENESSGGLLKVLAKLIAARVPGVPCVDVTESIVFMMNNIRVTLDFDQDWTVEKIQDV
jgi:hypothetical protein